MRLSHYVMIIMPGLIKMFSHRKEDNEWEISLIKYFYIFIKLLLKSIKNVVGVVIYDNNFAPSIFWSLCEFVNGCFGPQYSSLGVTLS